MKKPSYLKGVAVLGALSLVAAGCGAEEPVAGQEALAAQEGALVPVGTGGLPTLSQLQPLAQDTAQSGKVLLSSNNPETITSYGVLFSTQYTPGIKRGDTSNYPYTTNAPAATLVGSKTLDSTCPAGAVKDIGVYIAHIMGGGVGSGYVSLGVTPTQNTVIEVVGDLALGAWVTRDPNFVSNKVTEDYFFNPNLSRRTVSVTANQYNQIDVAGGSAGYIDGRLNLRIATGYSGCFYVHTLSQPTATASTTVPSTWAKGNVAWEGWYNGTGYGRGAGVFSGDKVAGSQSFSLPGPGYVRGYVVASAAQAYGASFYYADSAPVNFGNYGNFYDESFTVTNSGSTCMRVRAEFVSYAGVGATQKPTYSVYNAMSSVPSVYWNGPLRFVNTSGVWSPVEDIIVYATQNTTTPDAIVQTMRHGIELRTVAAGTSTTFRFQLGVPGLISSPGSFVFTSEGC
ncbi:MAG TPA: hypothetical protein VFZ09_43245 [Archangium sp.]|uniref:hypothetical protein n=1 Tax=Archangium sp. TaxID=1872627 RepID=UPI002E331932|nr:hypothetical protein [Archangium sp.]HEX5753096.1 hypothetical protein [Archangium sp.]